MVHPNMTSDKRHQLSIHLPRPLWIGLVTSVLLIAMAGLQFGLPIWRQQAAIREIERLGGRIKIELGGPEWMRKRVGDGHMKYFDHVVRVELTVQSANDSTLNYVAALTDVKVLRLGNSRITDDGLVNLRGLHYLEELWLGNTRVTDAGLAHLEVLPHLRDLSLANTRVTDAGLVHLRGLENLRRLSLGNARVTDDGIAELQSALPRLMVGR